MGTGWDGEVERYPPDRRDVGVDVVVTRGCDDEPVGDKGCDVPGIVFIRGRDEKEEYREQQRHVFESVRVVVFHAFYERCQFGGTERVMGERREEVLVSCILLRYLLIIREFGLLFYLAVHDVFVSKVFSN